MASTRLSALGSNPSLALWAKAGVAASMPTPSAIVRPPAFIAAPALNRRSSNRSRPGSGLRSRIAAFMSAILLHQATASATNRNAVARLRGRRHWGRDAGLYLGRRGCQLELAELGGWPEESITRACR